MANEQSENKDQTFVLKKPVARGALKSILELSRNFFKKNKSFASIALRTSLKEKGGRWRSKEEGNSEDEPESRFVVAHFKKNLIQRANDFNEGWVTNTAVEGRASVGIEHKKEGPPIRSRKKINRNNN
jgi:hypothetical protein